MIRFLAVLEDQTTQFIFSKYTLSSSCNQDFFVFNCNCFPSTLVNKLYILTPFSAAFQNNGEFATVPVQGVPNPSRRDKERKKERENAVNNGHLVPCSAQKPLGPK